MDRFLIRTKKDAPSQIPSNPIDCDKSKTKKGLSKSFKRKIPAHCKSNKVITIAKQLTVNNGSPDTEGQEREKKNNSKAESQNSGKISISSAISPTSCDSEELEHKDAEISKSNLAESDSSDDSSASKSDVEISSTTVKRVRTFRYQWLDEYKWLQNKDGSAFCKVCDTKITNIKSHLFRHDINLSHTKNMEASKGTPINVYFSNHTKVTIERQVKEAELMLVMFCIMHHLPFALMDFLPNLLTKCCPDSKIATKIKCGRTKANSIVQNILGEKGRQDVARQLRCQKFSIIIDETTDVSAAKALAVVARVFDKNKGFIRDRFLGLLKLTKTDAAYIYSRIVDHFSLLNIPLENVIGLGSDNASVMSGQFTGVQARFKEVVPNLFFVNCICHSLHLCASNACQKLPYSIEQLSRNIFNFFAHSSKRCIDLQEFQNFFSIKPHKILGVAQTRWLSLETVVNRILQQWDALQLYFLSCTLEDKGARNVASKLSEQLSDPINKIYFLFLSYALRIVNKMNVEFQSEQVRIHMISETMENNYKLVLSNFLKPIAFKNVNNISDIDFQNEENHLALQYLSMGSATESFLSTTNIDEDQLLKILNNIKQFYVELAQQIRKRFDFKNKIYKYFTLINPEKLISENLCLLPLLNAFPNLISNNIEKDEILDEFKLLRISSHLTNLNKNNIEEFWAKLGSLQNALGEPIYEKLSSFMMNLMSLPHSSAAAERIFSDLNQTKYKKTNRLLIETVDSIMAAKELLTKQERKSVTSNKASDVWVPRPEHNFS